MYQRNGPAAPAEALFAHVFGQAEGYMVVFTGRQARLSRPDARQNELTATRQESFSYPDEGQQATQYLLTESSRSRDAYFGVHLFREPDNRRATNASPTVSTLWLDEDEGQHPEIGPEPTAIVASSATRRHLYWQLSRPIAVEWAVAMNRRLAVWAGGDTGKAGLASVLRVPGTSNYKRHPQVDPVSLKITGADPWEPEVMEQSLPELPTPEEPRYRGEYDGPGVELAEYLSNVEVIGEVPDELGQKFQIICPWINEHSGGDRTGTYLGQRTGGGPWYRCWHEHCQGRTWREFRSVVRPKRIARLRRSAGDPNKAKKVVITRGS